MSVASAAVCWCTGRDPRAGSDEDRDWEDEDEYDSRDEGGSGSSDGMSYDSRDEGDGYESPSQTQPQQGPPRPPNALGAAQPPSPPPQKTADTDHRLQTTDYRPRT